MPLRSKTPSGNTQSSQHAGMTEKDFEFMSMAIVEARKGKPEDDQSLVGAVVVKNGKVLATGFHGERRKGRHAEDVALEGKLKGDQLAGSTVYTTLEPCTKRALQYIPCAKLLIARKVSRVVIGMLDPNQNITGKGIRTLREANITVDLFPSALMGEVEEMNREFTRSQEKKGMTGTVVSGADDIIRLIEKLFMSADKHIRFLLSALGARYKIPDNVAKSLAREIRRRERTGEGALRFCPIIMVDKYVPTDVIMDGLLIRRQLYAQFGVHKFVEPKFLITEVPFGFDVLLIDNTHTLLCFTTSHGSQVNQIAIHIDQNSNITSEIVDWFNNVICKDALSFEAFRTAKSIT